MDEMPRSSGTGGKASARGAAGGAARRKIPARGYAGVTTGRKTPSRGATDGAERGFLHAGPRRTGRVRARIVKDCGSTELRKYTSWLLALLGVGVFILCLWMTDLPSPSLLLDIDPWWLAVGVLAQGGLAVMMPYRWIVMSRGAGIDIPYLPACRLTAFMSLAGAVVPQSVADLGGRGLWAARRTGSGLLDACNVVLCDRLLDVYAIGLFLPVGVAYAYRLAPPWVCMVGAAGMALLGFGVLYVMKGRFFLLFDLCFRCVRWTCDLIPALRGRFDWHVSPISLSDRTLIVVYAVSMVKFGLITLGTLAYFKAVHIDVPVVLVFFALPITQFVFIFAMTPGGLGIFELGWVGVLTLNGLPAADIGLFLVSQRLCATVAVLVWAVLAFVLIRKTADDGVVDATGLRPAPRRGNCVPPD